MRYRFTSGGYSVTDGELFLGRVTSSRQSYEHSNGRTYRAWSWSAYPVSGNGATFHFPTRTKAGQYLLRYFNGTVT